MTAGELRAVAETHRRHILQVRANAERLVEWIKQGLTPSFDPRDIAISDDMSTIGDLLSFVRRLAEMSPEDDEGRSCIFCGACPDRHAADCLWVIAQGAKP